MTKTIIIAQSGINIAANNAITTVTSNIVTTAKTVQYMKFMIRSNML